MELELNTFGAVVGYAMHLESESVRFYQSAGALAGSENLATVLGELAAEATKRLRTLERVRRENVTEMILNPIHGFHSRDYAPSFTAEGGDDRLWQVAIQTEEIKSCFYAMAATKIELAEASRALSRLGRGNQQNAERLVETH